MVKDLDNSNWSVKILLFSIFVMSIFLSVLVLVNMPQYGDGASGALIAEISSGNNEDAASRDRNDKISADVKITPEGVPNSNRIEISGKIVYSCSAMAYPYDTWQRVWYKWDDGSCLGNGPDKESIKFDDNYGTGHVAYGLYDKIKMVSSRTVFFDKGTYSFNINSDDGARFYVDDVLAIDDWLDQPYSARTYNVTFPSSGMHKVKIEWYENGGSARVTFDYSKLTDGCQDCLTPPVQTQSGNWRLAGWGGGGNGATIDVDPKNTNIVWSGSDVGGPFRSRDNGESWNFANKGYEDDSVISMAIDPIDDNNVYALGCTGLFKTTNALANSEEIIWKRISPNDFNYGWNFNPCWYWNRLIAINPKNTKEVFVGSAKRIENGIYVNGGGLWKGTENTDGTYSWKHLDSFSAKGSNDFDISTVVIDPQEPNNIYAGIRGGAAKVSRNGGASWQEIGGIWDISSIVIYPKNTSIIYASKTNGQVFKSTNKGISWTEKSISNSGFSLGGTKTSSLAIDSNKADNLYLGMRNWYQGWDKSEIFKTTNGGNSWVNINKKLGQGLERNGNPYKDEYISDITDVEMVAVDPNDFNTVYLAEFWGLAKSTDGGNNWKLIVNNYQIAGANDIAIDPNDKDKIYVTGGDAVLFFSDNYGQSYRHIVVDKPGTFGQSWAIAAANTNPTTIWYSSETDEWDGKSAIYQTIIRKSTDYGATWVKTTKGLPNVNRNVGAYPHEGGVMKIIPHPTKPNIVFAAIKGKGIYKTTDAGGTWVKKPNTDGAGYALAMAPSNSNILYASGRNWVVKSEDGGETWTKLPATNGLNEQTYEIAVHPTDPKILYITTQLYVVKSTNGGNSWEKVLKANDPEWDYIYHPQPIKIDPNNPKRIFVGINGYRPHLGKGVFISEDEGASWKAMDKNSLGTQWIVSLLYDPDRNTLWAGTQTGVFNFNLGIAPVLQTPYLGAPFSIPRIIQAEDFDNGGEGVAYHDVNSNNIGGEYRQTGVDIQKNTDGGYNVGWTSAGEWLEYSVNVPSSGKYTISARVAGMGGAFHVEFNGVDKTGLWTLPSTGGWNSWQTITRNITLEPGNQIMRVYLDSNTSAGGTENFDYFNISIISPCQSLSYPAEKWQRVWYNLNGSCLGTGPDEPSEKFDNNWEWEKLAYSKEDNIKFISSKTIFLNAGTHTFTLSSDDGSRLYIDDQLIINNWNNQSYTRKSTTKTFATAGPHKARIDFFENNGVARLTFDYVSNITTAPRNTRYGIQIDVQAQSKIPAASQFQVLNPSWARFVYRPENAYPNLPSNVNKLIVFNHESTDNAPIGSRDINTWKTYVDNVYIPKLTETISNNPDIQAIEVWNEQDLCPDMSYCPGIPAKAYAYMIKKAAAEIKARNPNIQVVIGGFASGDVTYVTDIINSETNALAQVDGVGLHPYGKSPEGWCTSGCSGVLPFGDLADSINEYRTAAGNKPIWITEIGYGTDYGAWQAEYLNRTFTVISRNNVPVLIWYAWQDSMSGGDGGNNWGLYTTAGNIKSSGTTFSTFNKGPTVLACSEGTIYGQCSSSKPKYCDNGNLLNKCSTCGCAPNQVCQINGTCQAQGQTPFYGTPFVIPTSIQAEDFDNGGEGISYHDNEANNLGNEYRRQTGVDIEKSVDTGGGYNIGWTNPGEWLEYSINVPTSAEYTMNFRIASYGSGGSFHVEFNGVDKTGIISVPDTIGWQSWKTISKNVRLEAGNQIMKIVMDTKGASGDTTNINYIAIKTLSREPYYGIPFPIPGIIQAEDFDNGGERLSYHDIDATNNGGEYRPEYGVDIQATNDTGGGYNVGWIRAGEWIEYSVNVDSTADYILNARVSNIGDGGTFHVEFNGIDKTGQIVIPTTGEWQKWQTVSKQIRLDAGNQIMRIFMDKNSSSGAVGNINYLKINKVIPPACLNMIYPSTKWQRTWYRLDGTCLGDGPDEMNVRFDNNWGWGILAYNQDEYVKFISSRSISLEAGTYNFTIGSDDGSKLYIDNELVIDSWQTQAYMKKSATRTFTSSGTHNFKIEFYENEQVARLSFDYAKIQTNTTICSPMSYPSSRWQRTWYDLNNSCIGNGPDELTERFDNNWGWGNLTNGKDEYVKFVSSRTMNLEAGTYNFTIGSDDGSRLYIDDQLLIDNWELQSYNLRSSLKNFSSSGSHRFRIEFFENEQVARLTFDYAKMASNSCNDGTVSGSCSINKPKYCDNGNLINRCSSCGCPSGTSCQSDGSCISQAQTPYLGTPFAVPGTIQAEDFDNGGEGVAYHDSDEINNGGQYRNEGVDVGGTVDTSGDYAIGWVRAGEWYEYTVNVTNTGNYVLSARVAGIGEGGRFHVEFNGVDKTGSWTIPNTGGWDTWQTISRNVQLSSGTQIMKVVIESNSSVGGTGNFNYFTLRSGSTSTCSDMSYPSNKWQRTWYHLDESCLGDGPDELNEKFDNNWGVETISYGLADYVLFVSGRTISFDAGTYNFTIGSDDGSKLYVDDVLLIDNWQTQPYTSQSALKTFSTSGQHRVRIEFYENAISARISFDYSKLSIQTCSDSTSYGSCSITKPKYCENGNLINKCNQCGCPTGTTCRTDGSCESSSSNTTGAWTMTGWGGGGNAAVIEIAPQNKNIMWSGADVGGPFKSTNAGENWALKNNGYDCADVISIAIDPNDINKVYTLCRKGLYKTTNGGESWSKISDPKMTFGTNTGTGAGWGWFRDIAINPQNTQEIYVGSAKSVKPSWEGGGYRGDGGGLWKTTNGGSSWQHINALSTIGASDIDVSAVTMDPSNTQIIYVGILKSEMKITRNGGASWEGTGLNDITSVVVSPADPNIVYAARQDGYIYRSSNKGASWTGKPISNSGYNLGNYKYAVLAIDSKNSNQLYLGMHNGNNNPPIWQDGQHVYRHAIYKTTNGGDSWQSINKKPARAGNPYIVGMDHIQAVEMIAIDPDNFNNVYVASFWGIYKSTDAGNIWTQKSDGFQISANNRIIFDPNDQNKVYVAGGDSVMMYSENYGRTWRHIWSVYGQSFGLAAANAPSGTVLFFSNGNDGVEAVSPPDVVEFQSRIRRATSSAIQSSTDSTNYYTGNVWQITTNGLPMVDGLNDGFPRKGTAAGIEVDPRNPNVVFAAIKEYGVYKTTNALASNPADVRWQKITDIDANAFAMSKSNPNYLYVSGRNNVKKSSDGGTTWTNIVTSSANGLNELTYDIAIDPVDPKVIYIASQRMVAKSSDEGNTWTRIYDAVDETGQHYVYVPLSVEVDQSNRNRVFIGVSGYLPNSGPGVYVSEDGGNHFSKLGTSLPRLTNIHLSYDPRQQTLWAGTQTGLFKIRLGGSSPSTCTDGTNYGTCSSTKPRYCDSGNLINRCSSCGCPSGTSCQSDGSCVLQSQTPYLGTPFSVPGTIQAEDFDNGGEGIAYHDVDTTNNGGQYRSEGVDVGGTVDTSSYIVNFVRAGEWVEYSVNVPSAGNYALSARVAGIGEGGRFHVEFNGIDKTGSWTIPNTGGWDMWQTISRNVQLSAGTQVMRVVIESNSSVGGTGNFNYFTISNAQSSFDYSISNGGSRTVTKGGSTTNTITSTLVSGMSQTLTYSLGNLPVGVTSSLSTASCTPTCTSTLTLSTSSSTPTGTSTINVNSNGGGTSKSTSFSLTVTDSSTVQIPQWNVYTINMNSASSYSNPYTQVTLTATFNGPNGIQKTVKGFWDGGNSYKVRFAPNIQGSWSYSITSTPYDSGLAKTGQFTAIAPVSSNHGFIRRDSNYPQSFVYDDGTRYFMWGQTYYEIIRNAMSGNSWQTAVSNSKQKGLNKVRMLIMHWTDNHENPYTETSPFAGNHDTLNLPHWQKIDQIVEYMASQGVAAEIIPLPDSAGDATGTQVQDERYIRYVIARYGAYSNVIWALTNEWEYGDGSYANKNYWNSIGRIFEAEDPWRQEGSRIRALTIHPESRSEFRFFGESWPSYAVIQYKGYYFIRNSNGGWLETITEYTNGDEWGNYGSIKNLGRGMPVSNDEYGYFSMNGVDRTKHRNIIWGITTGGGYGTAGDGRTVATNNIPIFSSEWWDATEYNDIKIMIDFWTKKGIEYWKMRSQNSRVSGTRVYALGSSNSEEMVVYAAVGGTISANLPTTATTYSVIRFNPRDGTQVQLSDSGNGWKQFAMPDSQDWVLWIKKK